MASLKLFTLDNAEIGSVSLEDTIVNTKYNPFIIREAVVEHLARKRQGTHQTKDRSLVSGSRKKLYRQKGTGNARAGSAQSPVRRHGGTVFGPVVRSHEVSINKKVKKKALLSAIAQKLNEKTLVVVDNLNLGTYKTKDLAQKISHFESKKLLFVYGNDLSENFALASRNLPYVKCIRYTQLNVYDTLNCNYLITTQDALSEIEKRLL